MRTHETTVVSKMFIAKSVALNYLFLCGSLISWGLYSPTRKLVRNAPGIQFAPWFFLGEIVTAIGFGT